MKWKESSIYKTDYKCLNIMEYPFKY